MNKKILMLLVVGMLCSAEAAFGINVFSDKESVGNSESDLWQLSASMGYSIYDEAEGSGEGKIGTGRVAFGFNPIHWRDLTVGLELGMQSGLDMEVYLTDEQWGLLEADLTSTIKPISDLLLTFQMPLNSAKTLFAILKGGLAYRQWHFDRFDVPNKCQFDAEVQAGFGIKVSSRAKVVAYYQGIYGGNVGLKLWNVGFDTAGKVENIPTQHSGFLSLVINL